MARRKAPAQVAPKTLPEAVALLARYATIAGEIAQVEQLRDSAVATIHAETDERIAPFEAELKDLFRMLKPWWAVACDELTEGKRKSIELGGCVLGHRMSTPSVKVAGDAEATIADLLDLGRDEFVRIKPALEKPAILRALATDVQDAALLAWLGLSASQREEFFIDRLPPKAATVEIVPDEEPAA